MAKDVLAIAASTGTGIGLGVGSHYIDKEDAKRAAAAGAPIPVAQQYGTWYHYGVPVASILLTAFGVLKGDWATRLLSIGGVLAGRKMPEQIEAASAPAGYSRWSREGEAKRAAAEAARRRGAGRSGGGVSLAVEEEEILS